MTPEPPARRPLRLLLVEDTEDDAVLLLRGVRASGYEPIFRRVEDAEAMRAALAGESWELIISDWSLPTFNALGALSILQESGLDIPLIIASGTVDEETAVAALRGGARDFLVKGKLSRLGSAIERELREAEARRARRKAEADLSASEARYRLLFDSNPMPLWVFEKESHRFLAVNDAACRHYGYREDEFLALRVLDVTALDDVAAMKEALRNPSDDLRVWSHQKRDGTVIHVELRGHDLLFDGKDARLNLVHDVTERRRLEDQLRQSQKMDAIGRLAGGIAHDFNNVLSVILTCGENLRETVDGPAREDADEVLDAARRAADLTKQLLMFSRKQVLAPRPLDLNEVLSGMDRMLRRILGADIDVLSIPFKGLGRVHADPSSIEQVIMNLVVNARDAMPTGGKLTLETANVTLDEDFAASHLGATTGPHVMLAVTDSGTGMDATTMGRIFEPFFTTKGVEKGTGLGLSTVFGIVQQSGGTVWVYSEVGTGTTFKVYLPRIDAAAVEERARPSVAVRGGDETILLVEDEDGVRAAARGILTRNGYRVIEARNGAEALLAAAREDAKIDLLLSDVIMPNLSGPELMRRLSPTRPSMKVLFMSGYTDDSILRHGVLDARIAYLQKPLSSEALASKVREVLDAPMT